MAKDRNTYAKHQREVEKKRKAEQKRERRSRKKQESNSSDDQSDAQFALSAAEQDVLSVFREYLMTPGKMLCFSGSNFESLAVPLGQLTRKGLLVAEKTSGGYSLTETGFAAMKGND